MDLSKDLKYRGVIRKDGRVVIPKEVRSRLGLSEETFYELEVYGKDKILITVITPPEVLLALSKDEIRIIEEAVQSGYFEVPKRATLQDLEKSLGYSKTVIDKSLKRINRQVLEVFLKRIKEPL